MLPDLTSCGYHRDTCVLKTQHPELRAVHLCDGGSSDHVATSPYVVAPPGPCGPTQPPEVEFMPPSLDHP